MPGNGNNKPPGVPSYSMDMSIIEDVDDSEEVLETMPVGSINMSSDTEPAADSDDWRKWYPSWQLPQTLAREQIGNCYEMTAEYLLTINQPYPGDKPSNEQSEWSYCSPPNRFRVEQVPGDTNDFQITDLITDFKVLINKSQLENPRFNIGHWYAKKRARITGVGLYAVAVLTAQRHPYDGYRIRTVGA